VSTGKVADISAALVVPSSVSQNPRIYLPLEKASCRMKPVLQKTQLKLRSENNLESSVFNKGLALHASVFVPRVEQHRIL